MKEAVSNAGEQYYENAFPFPLFMETGKTYWEQWQEDKKIFENQ